MPKHWHEPPPKDCLAQDVQDALVELSGEATLELSSLERLTRHDLMALSRILTTACEEIDKRIAKEIFNRTKGVKDGLGT